MFHCDPVLFHWLERAMKNGNCSLSDGMRLMAQTEPSRHSTLEKGTGRTWIPLKRWNTRCSPYRYSLS